MVFPPSTNPAHALPSWPVVKFAARVFLPSPPCSRWMQNQETAAHVAPEASYVESQFRSHHVWRRAGAALRHPAAGFKFSYTLFRRAQCLLAVVRSSRFERFPRKPSSQSLARPHPPQLNETLFSASFFVFALDPSVLSLSLSLFTSYPGTPFRATHP